MDFIKDSAVKTVNGIKTEFAKTAKRERQNGHAADLYAKTESNQNGLQTETAKRSQNGIKPKRIQNGFETESTKYRKNIEKSILPFKILRISCWVPEGQWN